MSLSALVYRSRGTLDIDVESLGAAKDDRTGEYYFSTPQYDGKFPREALIASEFLDRQYYGRCRTERRVTDDNE